MILYSSFVIARVVLEWYIVDKSREHTEQPFCLACAQAAFQ